jgi:hypothetical protein
MAEQVNNKPQLKCMSEKFDMFTKYKRLISAQIHANKNFVDLEL